MIDLRRAFMVGRQPRIRIGSVSSRGDLGERIQQPHAGPFDLPPGHVDTAIDDSVGIFATSVFRDRGIGADREGAQARGT